MIYVICFVMSILFCFLANKNFNNKILYYFLSFLSIIIPVTLASFRSLEIGTDLTVYLYPAFQKALSFSNFISYSNAASYILDDFIFRFVVFYLTKIFADFNYVLFFIQLITCTFFYFGCYNFKKNSNPVIIYSMFLFIYFNISLNLIRQFMALSILFYCFKYFNSNFRKLIIGFIIACLIHKTSIIFLIIYIIYVSQKGKYKKLVSISCVSILIISLLLYPQILKLLVEIGVFPSRYLYRYAIDLGSINFNFADTLLYFFIFIIAILKKGANKNETFDFLFLMNLITLIILQIGVFVPYGNRIAYYFGIFSFPLLSSCIKNSKKDKLLLLILTIIFLIIYFIFVYIISKIGDTYPFIYRNY